jgi:hypothetical protein
MSRYYQGSYRWLGAVTSSGSLTSKLLGPLAAVVQQTWPGDPEHLAYAARSTALRLLEDEAQADRVGLAAYVCNIGMVGWLERLTSKPGTLTLEERRTMEQHTVNGARILEPWQELDPSMGMIALAVRHHHERWDGRGYPDGLSGEEIPLASRVIGAAEALQAMLSPRPYRDQVAGARRDDAAQAGRWRPVRPGGRRGAPCLAGVGGRDSRRWGERSREREPGVTPPLPFNLAKSLDAGMGRAELYYENWGWEYGRCVIKLRAADAKSAAEGEDS